MNRSTRSLYLALLAVGVGAAAVMAVNPVTSLADVVEGIPSEQLETSTPPADALGVTAEELGAVQRVAAAIPAACDADGPLALDLQSYDRVVGFGGYQVLEDISSFRFLEDGGLTTIVISLDGAQFACANADSLESLPRLLEELARLDVSGNTVLEAETAWAECMQAQEYPYSSLAELYDEINERTDRAFNDLEADEPGAGHESLRVLAEFEEATATAHLSCGGTLLGGIDTVDGYRERRLAEAAYLESEAARVVALKPLVDRLLVELDFPG